MCDFLTDNPGESDFPTDQESWKPVVLSETDAEVKKVEEKMKALSTEPVEPKVEASPSSPPEAPAEIEADYSESEEISLKGALVKENPSLQESSTLPESSTPEPKGQPEVKVPSVPKAPPPGAEAEMQKLRPFLRFGTDIDSDVAKTNLTSANLALPKSSLKPRCLAHLLVLLHVLHLVVLPVLKLPSAQQSLQRGKMKMRSPSACALSVPSPVHTSLALPLLTCILFLFTMTIYLVTCSWLVGSACFSSGRLGIYSKAGARVLALL